MLLICLKITLVLTDSYMSKTMEKRDISIAILDLDATFRSATKELLEKEGYTVSAFSDHEQILSNLKIRKYEVFIIECLTQKTSLANLVTSIQAASGQASLFIFVSLILEKSAVKDVLLQTKSQNFFKKPVTPANIVSAIKDRFADQMTEEHEPFIEAICTAQLTSPQRINVLKQTATVHSYEVPRILSYLSRTQFCGTVKFKSPDTKDSQVNLRTGCVTKVEVDDPKSFFGALLVDKDFVKLEELELVLEQKNSKRIGERLIDSNLVSPHVIDLINIEQLGIRLGYLIKNTSYDIEMEEKSVDPDDSCMDVPTLQRFVSDWLHSKISLSWLKSFYLPFTDKKIIKGSLFADISPVHTLAPLNRMPKFAQELIQGITLQQLIEQKKYSEEDIMHATHLLMTQEFIYFDKQGKPQDHKSHLERLIKLKKEMETQNHFEILGLSDKAKAKEIKRSYYELSKLFHPDKVSPDAPPETKEVTNFIFAKISKANEILSDDGRRTTYLKELEKGFAEKILESESLFEEGRSFLKANQPAKARPLFEQGMALRPPTSEMRLQYIWSKLLTIPSNNNIESYLKELEADLNRIPPEDRHNSTYYFVKGLYLRQIGDLDSAEKTIKHALSITPNFIEAQRELHIVTIQKKSSKPVDFMKADLKDVVGMLFKKKK
jgi:curved DNA-binding protein CbpA/FixJ family two-component response regulator